MSEIADEGAAAKNGSGGGGGRRVMGGIGCVGGDAWLRRRGSGRGGRGGGQEREAEEERKGMVEGSRLCRGSSACPDWRCGRRRRRTRANQNPFFF